MPTFYPEDVDIDPSEFVDGCNKHEIEELINILIEGGHIKPTSGTEKVASGVESIFEEHLNALHGKWNVLTQEEESIIMNIAKRFV